MTRGTATLIDATGRLVVHPIETDGADGIRKLLGCQRFEAAHRFDNGDVLFVDEEGFVKPCDAFFSLTVRPDQPFAGNGVVLGRHAGDGVPTRPPRTTATELEAMVTFKDRAATRAQLRGKPHATMTHYADDGTTVTEVLSWWDDVLAEAQGHPRRS